MVVHTFACVLTQQPLNFDLLSSLPGLVLMLWVLPVVYRIKGPGQPPSGFLCVFCLGTGLCFLIYIYNTNFLFYWFWCSLVGIGGALPSPPHPHCTSPPVCTPLHFHNVSLHCEFILVSRALMEVQWEWDLCYLWAISGHCKQSLCNGKLINELRHKILLRKWSYYIVTKGQIHMYYP